MILEQETRPKRFLLVEDDDDHAEIVIRTLKKEKTPKSIDRALDGVEALQYLRGEGPFRGIEPPDVILLDLKLPKMDGHEVLANIKMDEKLCLLPVIVLTTSDAEVDRVKAYRLHANSYLVKPLDADQFHKMIQDMSHYWGIWNRSPQPA
jgi:CheY-like chemotaxis protein